MTKVGDRLSINGRNCIVTNVAEPKPDEKLIAEMYCTVQCEDTGETDELYLPNAKTFEALKLPTKQDRDDAMAASIRDQIENYDSTRG